VEKRHRVVRRAGAVVEAACGISANPYYSVQRFYRVSEARGAPDWDRLWFPGLEEHCRLVGRYRVEPASADAGLGPPARLAIPPSYPNSGIFPLTGCPDRRNGTSAEQSQDEIRLHLRAKKSRLARARVAETAGNLGLTSVFALAMPYPAFILPTYADKGKRRRTRKSSCIADLSAYSVRSRSLTSGYLQRISSKISFRL